MAAKDRLETERSRRAQVGKTVREDLVVNLDDLDLRVGQGLKEEEVRVRVEPGLSKLKEARAFVENLPKELGGLREALENKLLELGYKIEEARAFTGWERLWLRLGFKDWAEKSRRERQLKQSLAKTILEIDQLIEGTILRLDDIEDKQVQAKGAYEKTLEEVQNRLEAAQPEYERAREKREELEASLNSLKRDLEAGVFSATERPAKLKEYDELEKEFNETRIKENDRMVIIKVSQEAITELTKVRNAAAGTIDSVHQMKRQLNEKRNAFKPLWDWAMNAVRTASELERYNESDRTFNKVTELISEANIRVYKAATETAANRLEESSISDEVSQRLLAELMAATEEFKDRIAKVAEQVQKGKGAPGGLPSGTPKEPADKKSSEASDLDN